jgi:hypothetical protein
LAIGYLHAIAIDLEMVKFPDGGSVEPDGQRIRSGTLDPGDPQLIWRPIELIIRKNIRVAIRQLLSA